MQMLAQGRASAAFWQLRMASLLFCSTPKPFLQQSPNLMKAYAHQYLEALVQQSRAVLGSCGTPYPPSYMMPRKQYGQGLSSSSAMICRQYKLISSKSSMEHLSVYPSMSSTYCCLPCTSPFSADLLIRRRAFSSSCTPSSPCRQMIPRLYRDFTYSAQAALQKYSRHLLQFLNLGSLKQNEARLLRARGKFFSTALEQYSQAFWELGSMICLPSSASPFSYKQPRSVMDSRCPILAASSHSFRYSKGLPYSPFSLSSPSLQMASGFFLRFPVSQNWMALCRFLSTIFPSSYKIPAIHQTSFSYLSNFFAMKPLGVTETDFMSSQQSHIVLDYYLISGLIDYYLMDFWLTRLEERSIAFVFSIMSSRLQTRSYLSFLSWYTLITLNTCWQPTIFLKLGSSFSSLGLLLPPPHRKNPLLFSPDMLRRCDSKALSSALSLATVSSTSAGQLPLHLPMDQLISLNVFRQQSLLGRLLSFSMPVSLSIRLDSVALMGSQDFEVGQSGKSLIIFRSIIQILITTLCHNYSTPIHNTLLNIYQQIQMTLHLDPPSVKSIPCRVFSFSNKSQEQLPEPPSAYLSIVQHIDQTDNQPFQFPSQPDPKFINCCQVYLVPTSDREMPGVMKSGYSQMYSNHKNHDREDSFIKFGTPVSRMLSQQSRVVEGAGEAMPLYSGTGKLLVLVYKLEVGEAGTVLQQWRQFIKMRQCVCRAEIARREILALIEQYHSNMDRAKQRNTGLSHQFVMQEKVSSQKQTSFTSVEHLPQKSNKQYDAFSLTITTKMPNASHQVAIQYTVRVDKLRECAGYIKGSGLVAEDTTCTLDTSRSVPRALFLDSRRVQTAGLNYSNSFPLSLQLSSRREQEPRQTEVSQFQASPAAKEHKPVPTSVFNWFCCNNVENKDEECEVNLPMDSRTQQVQADRKIRPNAGKRVELYAGPCLTRNFFSALDPPRRGQQFRIWEGQFPGN